VILAAGAVMVAVFFTFALSGPLPPKEMGTILGVAVLLDAFLVRLLLLPVFLRLAGASAWYLPSWLDRILPDVHFGHGPAGGKDERIAVPDSAPTAQLRVRSVLLSGCYSPQPSKALTCPSMSNQYSRKWVHRPSDSSS
jgi:hypothetical protein